MRILIRNGKGGKDRYALLSQTNLNILRKYGASVRPKDYFFPGGKPDSPLTNHAIENMFNKFMKKAGITKKATVHTLRHCFATHLLEDGANIYHIKQLLGHADISTTTYYLHLLKLDAINAESPLDTLGPLSPDGRS